MARESPWETHQTLITFPLSHRPVTHVTTPPPFLFFSLLRWVERNGPFKSVAITLFLTPAGWALACIGSYQKNYGIEILYGITHGFGCGLAYISITSALQRWYPEFKGLATGIAVMGFGLGSFIWTTFGKNLMTPQATNPYGIAPLEVYKVQGIFAAIFLGGIALALPFLREPPPGYLPPDHHHLTEEKSCRGALVRMFVVKSGNAHATEEKFTFLQALMTQEMALISFAFFSVEITGLVFLSSAADMVQNTFGFTSTKAADITSYLNLVNFAGRVGWGFLSDKIGRKTFYLISAATQSFAVGTMALWIAGQGDGYGNWLGSFLIIGSLYGGGFGVIPAFMSDLFGPKISAATHGVMIGVWASAAIIGIPCFTTYTSTDYYLSGTTKITNSTAYIHNTYWLCALPTAGFFALLFLNVVPEDRELRQAKLDWRMRIFSYILRINFAEGGFTFMNKEAQAEEYAALINKGRKAESKENPGPIDSEPQLKLAEIVSAA